MKRLVTILLLFSLHIGSTGDAYSQCAMCRRNVETNKAAHQNKVGTGLNKGILYLMSVPYLIGIVGIAMWMKRRKEQAR